MTRSLLQPRDIMLEIARGLQDGVCHINKFGRNPDIDTATTPETVWSNGGMWVGPTAARIHDIVSDNAGDAAAGTGARTIRLTGLDGNFDRITEDLTLNGLVNVPTALSYRRIYRMKILTAGANRDNDGAISATAQVDGTVTNHMSAGQGQSHLAVYTVPRGFTGYMTNFWFAMLDSSGPTTASFDIIIAQVLGLDTLVPAKIHRHHVGGVKAGTSYRVQPFEPYKVFEEKTDIIVNVPATSNDNLSLAAGFDLILVDDSR